MLEIVSPDAFTLTGQEDATVFLAGSIEQGNAENWQAKVLQRFSNAAVTFLNPRRRHWDPTIPMDEDNPELRQQVHWELRALHHAKIVLMYLQPGTQAVISMLELGLKLGTPDLYLCCPPGFHRRGNVIITADYFGVRVYDDWDSWIESIENCFRARGYLGR